MLVSSVLLNRGARCSVSATGSEKLATAVALVLSYATKIAVVMAPPLVLSLVAGVRHSGSDSVPRFMSVQEKSIRDLTLVAPHSRHGGKTLGIRR